jgi:hypothetical protein
MNAQSTTVEDLLAEDLLRAFVPRCCVISIAGDDSETDCPNDAEYIVHYLCPHAFPMCAEHERFARTVTPGECHDHGGRLLWSHSELL